MIERKDRQPEGEYKAVVIRLPRPIYERLRAQAFEERRSMAVIVVEALTRQGGTDGPR